MSIILILIMAWHACCFWGPGPIPLAVREAGTPIVNRMKHTNDMISNNAGVINVCCNGPRQKHDIFFLGMSTSRYC
ncbi:hypothetical protein RRG08_026168 [Elysia crispata]|uniref:Secreted protein n=1 Tax=Elysia crispata TaxID=231223 RepID=A0AAE1DCS8_9GAST|nr:hypothetical protein RRG08_026168 [Elysia crispata]